MTRKDFNAFINQYKLYSFDGLVKVQFNDGNIYEAVWVTGLPQLDKSVDGKFTGLPEQELFYLFAEKRYTTYPVEEIEQISCIREKYLRK
jgi:hypothetical protein